MHCPPPDRPMFAMPAMPRRRALLSAACAGLGLLAGGRPAAAANRAEPLDLSVIESGHSLTDPIPPLLEGMVRAAGGRPRIARSTIPGSPLEWRWHNAPGYGLPDARAEIADYDVLVLTERVPLSGTMPYHASQDWALKWFLHAWSKGRQGRGARTVLYATWVGLDSGPGADTHADAEADLPWRERLPLEWARWQEIRDHVNRNRPADAPEMTVIPGTLMMADIAKRIDRDGVPGLKRIEDLFVDAIHLNEIGAYFIALAHFAVVYGRDPRGLPHNVGQSLPPTPQLAQWLQEICWRVLTQTPGTGLEP